MKGKSKGDHDKAKLKGSNSKEDDSEDSDVGVVDLEAHLTPCPTSS